MQMREKTSELLRMVLPLLSRHAADFGPESYALWFHFVAAERAELVAELEPVVASGDRLTGEQTVELYCRHLRDAEAQTLEHVRNGFAQILAQVASSTIDARTAAVHAIPLIAAASAAEAGIDNKALLQHSQSIAASLQSFGQQLTSAEAQINELQSELENVRAEARTDALTGLKNRRALDEKLHKWSKSAIANKTPLTLIMIDVDHFKRFNDEMGHLMGDKALRTVAAVLQQQVAPEDLAARFGGEEFAVLLAGKSLAQSLGLAEKLRAAVEQVRVRKTSTGETIRSVTISCGVSQFKLDEEPADFVERADSALYSAKQAGRNKVMVESA